MKLITIGLFAIVAIVVGLSGCDSAKDRIVYDGPEYVMFSDTLSYFPVSNSEDYLNLHVGSTVACDYDRTFAVEVDDRNSNAIEDFHYEIASNSVTIKAGERSAEVKIRGIYENINNLDLLSINLNLIAENDVKWDLYGSKTRVEIMKACPFDLTTFTGYCKVTSSFYADYMRTTSMRLVNTEVDDEMNSIVMRDFFYNGYDIKIQFDPSNPMEPFIDMDDQVLGSTAEMFGTIYGNGKVMVKQPATYRSYYNVCQSFVVQYISVYVENVGVVGTYINILEWISDEEAEQLKKQGY